MDGGIFSVRQTVALINASALILLSCTSDGIQPPTRTETGNIEANPEVSFRGIDNASDCRAVVRAEEVLGSVIIASLSGDGPVGGWSYEAVMSGNLVGETVEIRVLCGKDGSVDFVIYRTKATDAKTTDQIFTRIHAAFSELYGERSYISRDPGKFTQFICSSHADLNLGTFPDTEVDEFKFVAAYYAPNPPSCTEETRISSDAN